LSRPKGKAAGIRLVSITPRPFTVTGGNPPVAASGRGSDVGPRRGSSRGGQLRRWAPWFIEHIAVGFDLRFHRIAAVGTQPTTRVFALSVGLSVR